MEENKDIENIKVDKVTGEETVDNKANNVNDTVDHVIDRLKEEYEDLKAKKAAENSNRKFPNLNNIGCLGYLTICALISGIVKVIQAICSAKNRR